MDEMDEDDLQEVVEVVISILIRDIPGNSVQRIMDLDDAIKHGDRPDIGPKTATAIHYMVEAFSSEPYSDSI